MFCGTDLIGMAEEDTPNAVTIISDLSTFHTLSDRLLQGHLNTLFLGRLLIHPDGLGTDPAFQDDGTSLLTDDLVYYGISQGGIMGGATTAVAQDWTRAVLDVPGANYGLLLDRSVDFDPFRLVLDPSYPSPADRALGLQLIQMHWDSGEANGYLQHLIDRPVRRHAGARRAAPRRPRRPPGRQHRHRGPGPHARPPDPPAGDGGRPLDGGGAVVRARRRSPTPTRDPASSCGTAAPRCPPTSTSRRGRADDPHGDPRSTPAAIEQIVAFLTTGQIIDACGDDPCIGIPDE